MSPRPGRLRPSASISFFFPADEMDLVAIQVANIRAVIVGSEVGAKAWCAFVLGARRHCRCICIVNGLFTERGEGGHPTVARMCGHLVERKSYPKLLRFAGTLPRCPTCIFHGKALDSERREHHIVERDSAGEVASTN